MNAAPPPFSRPLAAAFALCLIAAPASAQEGGSGWTVRVGAGAQAIPKYPGTDSVRISPMGVINFRRPGEPIPFSAPDEPWEVSLVRGDTPWRLGPSLTFERRRRERDVGAPVGNVPFTVEPGAFIQYQAAPGLRLRLDGRRGLGGHDGWAGDISADFIVRDTDTYILSIGPRLRWADASWHRSYFGVTPAAAAASGLPAYDPGSGFYAAGAVASAVYQFNPRWGLYGYAGYERLMGDAADSPVVRAFGSRDRLSGGLALTYTFNVGGR